MSNLAEIAGKQRIDPLKSQLEHWEDCSEISGKANICTHSERGLSVGVHVIAPRDDVMEKSYFKSFSSSKMVALVGTLAWRLLLLLTKKLHLKLLKHKSLAFMLTGLQQQN